MSGRKFEIKTNQPFGATGYSDSLNPPLVTGGVTYMPVDPCSGRQNPIQLDPNPGPPGTHS